MENKPAEIASQPRTTERLPWHRPQVQVLTVSLDTGMPPNGSTTDNVFDAESQRNA